MTANTSGFSAIHRLSSIVFFGAKWFVKIILFPPNTCKTCFSAYFYFFSSKTLKMQCSALTFLDCLSLLYIIFCLFKKMQWIIFFDEHPKYIIQYKARSWFDLKKIGFDFTPTFTNYEVYNQYLKLITKKLVNIKNKPFNSFISV